MCFGQKCVKGNCKNGQGTCTHVNGDKYVGEWNDGLTKYMFNED